MRSLAVLAGGLGTRLRDVVSDVPKPMAPVAGRPFLAWLLDGWLDRCWRFDRVVLSVGYRAEVIREFFGDQYRGVPVQYIEEDWPLGTGGALVNLCRYLDGEVCVVNGDTWFMPCVDFSWPANYLHPEVTMLLKAVDSVERYSAILLCDEHRVLSIRRNGTGSGLVHGGVSFLNEAAVALAASQGVLGGPFSLEEGLFDSWLTSRQCEFTGYLNEMPFMDIGEPETYLRSEKFLMDQQ